MNKAQLISRYNSLAIDLKESRQSLVLSGGAALVILGLREKTAMLNVIVGPALYKYLTVYYKVKIRRHFDPFVAFNYVTRIHEGGYETGVVCVDGIWIQSPFELLKHKRAMVKYPNRNPHRLARDYREIAILEEMARSPKITARSAVSA